MNALMLTLLSTDDDDAGFKRVNEYELFKDMLLSDTRAASPFFDKLISLVTVEFFKVSVLAMSSKSLTVQL